MAKQSLTKLAYHTLQQGKTLAGIAHKGISQKLMDLMNPTKNSFNFPVDRDILLEIRKSISKLERIDWEEAEAGLYPKSQLFEAPWIEWAIKYPMIWLDMPSTWERRKKKKTRDIPQQINKELYPNYYLQNFHHQTDGYLSDHSARLYDIQVEILFNGTADLMRRRILSPLVKGLKRFRDIDTNQIKVLDIATGTGRTLQQIKSALPDIELLGLDLSGSYLKQASKYLSNREGDIIQLIKANAEDIPFRSSSLQGITCVFLMHELPREARQNVINEAFRLLEPGGIFILADSIQIADSPKFLQLMDNFHKNFHEPYYKDYINDDIDLRLDSAGFTNVSAKSYFMTRVWEATKPI